jgi:thioesterase domain-containing protein
MAKRDNATNAGTTKADAMEQRVLAFAEQLGRIAGTFQAKAEGWLDGEVLTEQIASVRDSAAELLEQLAGVATKGAKRTPAATAAIEKTKGRSGGVVDAPGKKHRKPMPADPGANLTSSQAAKMRMARTMVKTNRRRGRG